MRLCAAFLSTLLLCAFGSGQASERALPGYCPYGCGPYVPMITTPSLSLQTVSPNPAGASNATSGLVAGATNSTLSEINGNTDSVYTVPVWYSGGGMPLVSPATNSLVGSMRMNAARPERREQFDHIQHEGEHEGATQSWIYYASAGQGPKSLGAASAAKGVHPTKKSYTNDDVQRQNANNGVVKWDSKSEKIQ